MTITDCAFSFGSPTQGHAIVENHSSPPPERLRRAYSGPGGGSGGSVDWQSVLETAVGSVLGVIAGWLITARYARRGSQELRREAEKLRQLTLKLIRILPAALESVLVLLAVGHGGALEGSGLVL
jgi:peptidoglycan/LPS O-acetylase OafA/YrhL